MAEETKTRIEEHRTERGPESNVVWAIVVIVVIALIAIAVVWAMRNYAVPSSLIPGAQTGTPGTTQTPSANTGPGSSSGGAASSSVELPNTGLPPQGADSGVQSGGGNSSSVQNY